MKRKLAAILFADIVGFSQHSQLSETTALEQRRQVEQVLKAAAATYGGRFVKDLGDGAMLEFASAVDAVSAALQIQRELQDPGAPLGTGPIPLRIGIHIGDV